MRNKCTCCGASNHGRKECRHVLKECTICGKVGHLAAVCWSRGKTQDLAKPTANPKVAAKTGNAEAAPQAPHNAWAPAWYCQECGEGVRSQLNKCPVKGCAGKKATPTPKDPDLLLLSKSMRSKVEQKEEPPAEEEEGGEEGQGETPLELKKLLNVESSYTNNDMTPPQDLLDRIAACRKKHAMTPESKEEKVTKLETERDIRTERIRLVKKEAADMTKAHAELAAAEEAVKKGIEMRAAKIKEAETAHRLQMEAIKTDFDAGDEAKRLKVEAAKQKITDLTDNHRRAIERLDFWENKGVGSGQKAEATNSIAADAVGDPVGGDDLRLQVMTALEEEEQRNPGESVQDIVTAATINVYQANMEAIIARVRQKSEPISKHSGITDSR